MNFMSEESFEEILEEIRTDHLKCYDEKNFLSVENNLLKKLLRVEGKLTRELIDYNVFNTAYSEIDILEEGIKLSRDEEFPQEDIITRNINYLNFQSSLFKFTLNQTNNLHKKGYSSEELLDVDYGFIKSDPVNIRADFLDCFNNARLYQQDYNSKFENYLERWNMYKDMFDEIDKKKIEKIEVKKEEVETEKRERSLGSKIKRILNKKLF